MLFNSISFFFFFIAVSVFFFILPHRFRWMFLLAASCFFYCAFIPVYLFILFFTIIIDYIAGIAIENSQAKKRLFFLLLSLIANLGVLAFFKYYNFFIDNINFAFNLNPSHSLPFLNIILPIGLSFHTFQAMSYTLEVYHGRQKAERHLGIYSLYVMFYPQLVAGPIERPQNMLSQFYEEKKFDQQEAIAGIQQMLWGLFKKVVVADQLATYVNSIYNNWELNTGLTPLFATYMLAFQIYCDFSGYSDIAQGAARVMGFRLMDNFSLPYFSKSITEFWRRWHISLSSWLRDYLYIPLGGNRNGKWNAYKNLLITMLLGGLWHGASWNFIIWGFLNGVYLSIEKFLGLKVNATTSPLRKILSVFLTFNLISLTWIFFRSANLRQAIGIVKNIFSPIGFWNLRIQDSGIFAGMIFGLLVLLCVEYFWLRKTSATHFFSSLSFSKNIIWAVSLIILIVLFGVSEGDQFIYFQF